MSYIGNISSRLSVSNDRGPYQHIHMHNLCLSICDGWLFLHEQERTFITGRVGCEQHLNPKVLKASQLKQWPFNHVYIANETKEQIHNYTRSFFRTLWKACPVILIGLYSFSSFFLLFFWGGGEQTFLFRGYKKTTSPLPGTMPNLGYCVYMPYWRLLCSEHE